MLANYLPILIFIVIGMVLGAAPVVLSGLVNKLLGKTSPDPSKLAAYECGFTAFENARLPFDVRFYLVAILFIIFDLETAFLVPWAVVLRNIGWFGFAVMGVFLGLLLIGFIYEWKKGALEWE